MAKDNDTTGAATATADGEPASNDQRLEDLIYGDHKPATPPDFHERDPIGQQATPSSGKPAEEPKAKPKADEPPTKKGDTEGGENTDENWDLSRQRRDQAAANERKKANAEIEDLRGQVQQFSERLKKADTNGKPDNAQEVDDLAEAQKLLDNLDEEDPDPADLAAALRTAMRAIGTKQSAGDSKEVKTLRNQVTTLQERLDAREARDAAREEDAQWNDHLERCETDYGPDHRAEAMKRASKYFADRGYSRDNPPPDEAAMARVELEWSKLAAAKKAQPNDEPETEIDRGSGGAAAIVEGGGTLDDVGAAMRKEGKFRNFRLPSTPT